MDIYCHNCGEPYTIDYVLHDEPQLFKRQGCVIFLCPGCKGAPQHLSAEEENRLIALRELAYAYGDDIDGYATEAEDFLEFDDKI